MFSTPLLLMMAASDWSLHATKLHIIEHVLNLQLA